MAPEQINTPPVPANEQPVDVPAFVRDFPKKIPGAAGIDVVVNPPNAAMCIVHVRQLHRPAGGALLSRTQMSRNTGPIVDGATETWEDLVNVQTGIHAILGHFANTSGVHALLLEGIARQDAAADVLADIHRAQRHRRSLFAEIMIVNTLATIANHKDNADACDLALANPQAFDITTEQRRKEVEAEAAESRRLYALGLPTVPKLIASAKNALQSYIDSLEKELKTPGLINPRDVRDSLESARAMMTSLSQTDQEQILRSILKKVEINRVQMSLADERTAKFTAEFDSTFLGSGDTLQSGRMKLLASENVDLSDRAVTALRQRNMKLYKELQAQREDLAIERAAASNLPIVPMVYGGAHDFRRAVEAWNINPKNAAKKIALIVITPYSYPAERK